MKNLNLICLFFISFSLNGILNACPTNFAVNVFNPICNGDSNGSINIVAIEDGSPPFTYSFDDGITFTFDGFVTDIPAGDYEVIVKDNNGCEFSKTVTLFEAFNLIVDIGQDISVNLGEQFEINSLSTGLISSAEWSSTSPNVSIPDNILNPLIFPIVSQTITLKVTDYDGCMATDAIQVIVEKPLGIFIPNVFTPNGDGVNDFFAPFGGPSIQQILKLQITSPWNEIVFESANFSAVDPVFGWDGKFKNKLMNEGVYMYCIEFKYIDGERKMICGDVTLLR